MRRSVCHLQVMWIYVARRKAITLVPQLCLHYRDVCGSPGELMFNLTLTGFCSCFQGCAIYFFSTLLRHTDCIKMTGLCAVAAHSAATYNNLSQWIEMVLDSNWSWMVCTLEWWKVASCGDEWHKNQLIWGGANKMTQCLVVISANWWILQ